jgi:hypothetical protein
MHSDALDDAFALAPSSEQVTAALAAASAGLGLAGWYADCVRPLLRSPRAQWPGCCGGGCEPCAASLVAVADETLRLLGRTEPWSVGA